jgi:hypothetical protein
VQRLFACQSFGKRLEIDRDLQRRITDTENLGALMALDFEDAASR